MQQVLIGLQGYYPSSLFLDTTSFSSQHTRIIGMWLWVRKLGSTLR